MNFSSRAEGMQIQYSEIPRWDLLLCGSPCPPPPPQKKLGCWITIRMNKTCIRIPRRIRQVRHTPLDWNISHSGYQWGRNSNGPVERYRFLGIFVRDLSSGNWEPVTAYRTLLSSLWLQTLKPSRNRPTVVARVRRSDSLLHRYTNGLKPARKTFYQCF